jgi:DNA-binding transcriptional regulator/RsmH inhibitor MraZ
MRSMFRDGLLKGKRILVTGGGNFARLSKLSEAEWDKMRDMIRTANEKDKAQRSV